MTSLNMTPYLIVKPRQLLVELFVFVVDIGDVRIIGVYASLLVLLDSRFLSLL